MGILTQASGGVNTELAGDNKLLLRKVTLAANSDTLTLVRATDGITTIQKVFAQINTGGGANFAFLNVSFSGLVITIASFNAAGAVATSFGDVDLLIIGY
jgi:hypothetical protein